MPTILDLPREIFELVFSHLIDMSTPQDYPSRRSGVSKSAAASLRLVCREWEGWLFAHHLYHSLRFSTASRLSAFIDHLNRRSSRLPHATCEHLEVINLWSVEKPPQARPRDAINSEILESLLELFSDTIITLHIIFVDIFTLPSQTIKAIGRVKDLTNLKLKTLALFSGSESSAADPACLHSLMMEAQSLKSLQVSVPFVLPSIPDLTAGARYPAITHLEINVRHLSANEFLSIATALKPSLKLLYLGSGVEDSDPVYETLKETLEALSVYYGISLIPIIDLPVRFSKLRVLAMHRFPHFNLLRDVLLSHTSIEIVAISAAGWILDTMTLDTFSDLPQFKKLVLMNAPPDYTIPPLCLAACEAHRIQCVTVDHDKLPLLMEL
ncbi:hypothetical protein PCANC_00435 [Puccinia coronata f. sp. avenae]|uniref:F-box domain-containing protein n=1 Tax=Puccinia coronata f. sp. avenae TaxID=200324 RepID=A0A2N5W9J2_9BASI|nr:hypothetical protein PCANC_00435 [Puccinia coronata f. sp. avenae]